MLRDGSESLEGQHVLSELPGDLGLLLWRTMRDVMLWAATPSSSRDGLFAPGIDDVRAARLAAVDVPAPITTAVDTLTGMLSRGSGADADLLAICCLEVAAWARLGGLLRTAVAFAQAGAAAAPDLAEAALHTGLYAAMSGQEARAETWLRRAVALARRERDRDAYTTALVELGEMHERRGDADEAERLYRWAYKAGRRFGVSEARMRAAHGAFRLARQRNDERGAERFATLAQRASCPDVRGAPLVLLDLTRFWCERGETTRARAAGVRLWQVREQLPAALRPVASALVSRALAQAGEDAAEPAADAWVRVADKGIAADARVDALFDLAHAAVAQVLAFRPEQAGGRALRRAS